MKLNSLREADRRVSFRAHEALLRVSVLGIILPALVAGEPGYKAR